MDIEERLQQRKERLERRLSFVSEKINRMEQSLILENRADETFRLETLINESQAVQTRIERELDAIEQQLAATGSGDILAEGDDDYRYPYGGDIITEGGDFIFGDKIFNLQLFAVPRQVGRFFKQNLGPLSLIIALELLLALLFFQNKDWLLLSESLYLVMALLLPVVVWSWVRLNRSRPRSLWGPWVLMGIATIAWVGLLGWQAQAVLSPHFEPRQFGIAVATFGDGPDYRVSTQSRQISEILREELDLAIQELDLMEPVATTRIGVVANRTQAVADGSRVEADLVIRGWIAREDTAGKEGVRVFFEVLETENITDNPNLPQILPVTRPPLKTSRRIITATTRSTIQEQAVVITAFSLGLYYYLDLNFEEAIIQFTNARNRLEATRAADNVINPGLIDYYLGRSYQILGKYRESQEAFDRAAASSPDDPAILLGQAYNQRVFGESDLRKQTLDKLAKLCANSDEKDIPTLYDCAVYYRTVEDYPAALRKYERIINLDETFFLAYLGAGRTHIDTGELDQAEAMYQTAEDLAAGDSKRLVWVYIGKGQLYEEIGKGQLDEEKDPIEAAINEYKQAINLNGALASPHFYLAELYKAEGRMKEAENEYQILADLSDDPDLSVSAAWAHGLFATFLCDTGKYGQAIEQYEIALQYQPYDTALLQMHLGLAYTAADEQTVADKEKQARAAFEAAIANAGTDKAYIQSQ